MNVPEHFQREIVSELKAAAALIRKSEDDAQRAYSYSAAYGVFSRVIRFHYDPALLFASVTLQESYNIINGRINQIASGVRIIPILDEVWEGIAEALEEIAKRVTDASRFYDLLQRITVLTYLTTGAGYYMYTRGQLKL